MGVRAIPDDSNDDYVDNGYGKRANDRDNSKRSERNDINDYNEYSTRRATTSGRLGANTIGAIVKPTTTTFTSIEGVSGSTQ